MSTLAGLYTLEEAAKALGLSVRTLQRRIAAGLLVPYSGHGRHRLFLAADLLNARTWRDTD